MKVVRYVEAVWSRRANAPFPDGGVSRSREGRDDTLRVTCT
jgi:hypothetical protein